MTTHVAIAYRWGYINEHQYMVGAWKDINKALQASRQECEDRAGKYGIAVRQVKGKKHKQIAYFPSRLGEDEPMFSATKFAHEEIGRKLTMHPESCPKEVIEKATELGEAMKQAWAVAIGDSLRDRI